MTEHEVYYDREARVAYISIMPGAEVEYSEETGWGLIDRDKTDRPVGIEIWQPTRMFPDDFLEALPQG